MSIIIKGMDMPDSCFHCKLAEVCQHYKAEHYANKRHEDCPLEEVPETHDKRTETHTCDLIDRQAAIDECNKRGAEHVGYAIAQLPSAQPDLQLTCNQLATDSNTHKALDALDFISRQAAIDELYEYKTEPNISDDESEIEGFNDGIDLAISVLSVMPSAQPTLYGYNIEHLACIARVMEKEGITAEVAVNTFLDVGHAVKMILDEARETAERREDG